MAVIIWTEAGEVAGENGERMEEMLRGMAASVLLFQEGDVGEVVGAIGSTLHAPHMNSDRIRTYFGRCYGVEDVEVLDKITRERESAEIRTRGDLASELVYGNHRNTAK